MTALSDTDLNPSLQRAKKKHQKMTIINEILDDHTQLTPQNKVNSLILIVRELMNEQSQLEKALALKEEREKELV